MYGHKNLRQPSQYNDWATGWMTWVQFLPGRMTGSFPPHHHIWTGFGAYPAPYLMGTRGSLPSVKVLRV